MNKYQQHYRSAAAGLLTTLSIFLGYAAGAQSTTRTQKPPAEKIYTSVRIMPKPSVDVMDYLSKNLHYPEAARKAGIEGRVIAQFVVTKTGKLKDVVIQRGIHPDCDAEVMRILYAMPDWEPGWENGKAVNVYYTVPVSFRFAKDEAEALAVTRRKAVEATDGSKTFTSVEVMPKPAIDLSQYLSENLRYPAAARDEGIEGRVIAQFVVSPTGALRDIKIMRGLRSDCDAEVLRVLRGMPAFKPGTQDGKPVSVYYTLPVSFKLDKGSPAPVPQASQSGIMAVQQKTNQGLRIHPNPVNNEVKFYILPEKAGTAQVYIRDMSGREVIHKTFVLKASVTEVLLQISVNRLPPGTYLLDHQLNGLRQSARFVVRR